MDVEGFAEILAKVMAGARLERKAVLHHGLDRVRFPGSSKLLGARLGALDNRHGHGIFGHLRVEVQDAQRLFAGLCMRGVRGMSFLPEEFRGPQEHPRAQFPTDDVGPLIEE